MKQNWQSIQSSHLMAVAVLLTSIQFCLPAVAENEVKKSPPGYSALEKQGCLHCHFVNGDGGLVGPPLNGIRKYRTEENIIDVLTKKRELPFYYPKGVLDPREFMRHVKLDKSTATDIAKYLMTLPEDESIGVKGHADVTKDAAPKGFSYEPAQPNEATRRGLATYREAGCAACHAIGGQGGRRGPELDGVGARLSKNGIENAITHGAIVTVDGEEYKPTEYSMPPTQLAPTQVKEITDFLLTLPTKK